MKIYAMVEFDLNSDYLEDLEVDLADLRMRPDKE